MLTTTTYNKKEITSKIIYIFKKWVEEGLSDF